MIACCGMTQPSKETALRIYSLHECEKVSMQCVFERKHKKVRFNVGMNVPKSARQSYKPKTNSLDLGWALITKQQFVNNNEMDERGEVNGAVKVLINLNFTGVEHHISANNSCQFFKQLTLQTNFAKSNMKFRGVQTI
eukprot:3919565-Ditylum_brightwellii.AAC.1